MKLDYLSVTDLSPEKTKDLILRAIELKKNGYRGKELEGKTVALIFEKPSLRTRTTFEVAIVHLGGYPIYLAPGDIKLGVREPVKDVARNLDKWVDAIVARVFAHKTLEELAEFGKIPVVNALSDLEHPCQALADFMTIYEISGSFKVNLSFIGDSNNVANSLMLLSAMLGTNFTLAHPPGYEPDGAIVEKALDLARKSGSVIKITTDPLEAAKNADFVYTDVWTSMGQEAEREKRLRDFQGYQVNDELLKVSSPDVKVMHCLPAHRGEEITDEVIESEKSVVFQQAENRLHTEKALFLEIFKG